MARLTMLRRLQECAHCLKTRFECTESSKPPTKHCSAFAWSAVRSNDNEYNPIMFSLKIPQKSPGAAYRSSFMCGLLGRDCNIAFMIPSYSGSLLCKTNERRKN